MTRTSIAILAALALLIVPVTSAEHADPHASNDEAEESHEERNGSEEADEAEEDRTEEADGNQTEGDGTDEDRTRNRTEENRTLPDPTTPTTVTAFLERTGPVQEVRAQATLYHNASKVGVVVDAKANLTPTTGNASLDRMGKEVTDATPRLHELVWGWSVDRQVQRNATLVPSSP